MVRLYITFLLILFCGVSFGQNNSILGFNKKDIDQQLALELKFKQNLSAENIGAMMQKLSAVPHHISSEGSRKNAEYIVSLYKKWGWDAQIETFHVLFPTPKTRKLEMLSPAKYQALLKEPAIKEDPTSGQAGQLPTFNAYSADGDVTGELVFVNYGLPDDYKLLD
ncbi:MAG: folate hydrolase, partial [Ginsengibacter sp.]